MKMFESPFFSFEVKRYGIFNLAGDARSLVKLPWLFTMSLSRTNPLRVCPQKTRHNDHLTAWAVMALFCGAMSRQKNWLHNSARWKSGAKNHPATV
ncbi:hypothetical protein [Bellilinea caldifistulae]|uniref:hypothetical protein n=1 Tax=Bellilinea caldifistulae TaxID=360411 RepID=UPI0011AE98CB|nr:hypothetical protein [Bellilinea caldifistulae]